MKGLFKRGDVWWVRFTPRAGAAQERVSLETRDELEAMRLARVEMAAAATRARERMHGCAAEVENYLAHCKRQGLSAATIEHRMYVLRGFVAWCDAASPGTISHSKAGRWFEMRADKNPHTADAYLVVVRYWFRWLRERGKLRSDPTAGIDPPKLPMMVRKVFLSPERARKFLDACEDEEMKFILYCAVQQGMRKMEVIEARREWFDLEEGLIHIQKTETFEPKGRRNRTVPMTDEFRNWLREWLTPHPNPLPEAERGPDDFMLKPDVVRGRYRYRYDFRTRFENYVAAQGESITFHDLRRTFGSLLVSRGVSLYKVAKWLGDTLKVAESTYGHLVAQDEEINAAWK